MSTITVVKCLDGDFEYRLYTNMSHGYVFDVVSVVPWMIKCFDKHEYSFDYNVIDLKTEKMLLLFMLRFPHDYQFIGGIDD